ncbi:MAG TPA: hypothetical protein DEF41_05580 [Desulfovibrio sp.]|nr:hypothetical protein [Desulfovibrio sp.]
MPRHTASPFPFVSIRPCSLPVMPINALQLLRPEKNSRQTSTVRYCIERLHPSSQKGFAAPARIAHAHRTSSKNSKKSQTSRLIGL